MLYKKISNLRNYLPHKSRILYLIGDVIIIITAYFLSYLLRYKGVIDIYNFSLIKKSLPLIILIKMMIFSISGLYRSEWRYRGVSDLIKIFQATFMGSFISIITLLFLFRFDGYSRLGFIYDHLITFLLIAGVRISVLIHKEFIQSGYISKKIHLGISNIKKRMKSWPRLISKWIKVHRRFIFLLISGGTTILSVALLVMGINEISTHLQENKYLAKITQQLRTEDAQSEIEGVVRYVYKNSVLSIGEGGLLNPSAAEILQSEIGGRCGEFSRVSINLLHHLGYRAHRVYLFPSPTKGRKLNPRSQVPFHVMAEVRTEGRWVAIDPTYGFVFKKGSSKFATMSDLAQNQYVIYKVYKSGPIKSGLDKILEEEKTGYRQSSDYQNPQRINWSLIAKIPGIYELAHLIFRDKLSEFYLPIIFEQPHLFLGTVRLFFGLVTFIIALILYRQAFLKRR